jgi:aminoglycoside phosphotransferase family enzyme
VLYDGDRYKLTGNEGEIVEFAVKMKRIPDHQLMKSLFHHGKLRDVHLEKLASTLASFHQHAAHSAEIDEFGEPDKFKINTDENFAQTEKYIGVTIQDRDFEMLREWTADFYVTNRKGFMLRIRQNRIRDCHGDLHMEHVCFGKGIYVFDCIEFNDRLRYSDTLADIAFLLMDLEFYGGEDHSRRLWRYYSEMARETDVDALLTFYKVYRAYVRGKVTSFQSDDEHISSEEREKARHAADKYFALASSYVVGGH